MKLCRFLSPAHAFKSSDPISNGLIVGDGTVLDLTAAGWPMMESLLERDDLLELVGRLAREDLRSFPLSQVRLHSPVERQEVWAAGVTYLRSKKARMGESDFCANAYDRVYEAERPELFFKALPEKVVSPGDPVGIRKDARWSVPEPELALVINSRRRIVGYTIGNDMSSRDIEGENLLYLPQAKIYDRSCAIGPWIAVGACEDEARNWSIQLQIRRHGQVAFEGETSVGQIKRSFEDLVAFLFRGQTFPHGVILLTGTGVVPPNDFSLRPGDLVRITISGVGVMEHPVVEV